MTISEKYIFPKICHKIRITPTLKIIPVKIASLQLIIITWSPVSMWGVKVGLCFPTHTLKDQWIKKLEDRENDKNIENDLLRAITIMNNSFKELPSGYRLIKSYSLSILSGYNAFKYTVGYAAFKFSSL